MESQSHGESKHVRRCGLSIDESCEIPFASINLAGGRPFPPELLLDSFEVPLTVQMFGDVAND